MKLFFYILCFLLTACGQKSTTISSVDLVGEFQTYGGLPQRELAVGETERFQLIVNYDDKHWENKTTEATWSTNMECPTSSSSGTPGDAIASISAEGVVTAKNSGTVVIVGTLEDFIGCFTLTVSGAALNSIEVTPTNPSIAAGTTKQFTATGIYADGTTADITSSVTWTAASTSIATISNTTGSRGLATGVSPGVTVITATLGSVSGNTNLTVTNALLVSIAVTPTNPSIPLGLTKQFACTGTYTDNSTQDCTNAATWTSSALGVATINATGLATSVGLGTTTITATVGALTATSDLTVTAAALSSIAVAPANPSIALGLAQNFTATGSYTDGSTQDLTATVVWSSSDNAVATISNIAPNNGRAQSQSIGSTVITATSGSISGTANLTVTAATLVSIDVTPNVPSVAKGLTQQFTATGTYTDGTTQNLTSTVVWSTSDASIATVSNAGGSQGLATAVDVGAATITATSGAVSANEIITVTAATLQSIAVTPAGAAIAKTHTRQYTANGTYSDGSVVDITTLVTWSSSSNATATISNAIGSKGLATGVAIGFVRFTATLTGVSGSANATITP